MQRNAAASLLIFMMHNFLTMYIIMCIAIALSSTPLFKTGLTVCLKHNTYPHCGLTKTSRLQSLDDVCGPLDGLGDLGRGRGYKFNAGVMPESC